MGELYIPSLTKPSLYWESCFVPWLLHLSLIPHHENLSFRTFCRLHSIYTKWHSSQLKIFKCWKSSHHGKPVHGIEMKLKMPELSNEMLSSKKYLPEEIKSMWVELRHPQSQLALQIHLDLQLNHGFWVLANDILILLLQHITQQQQSRTSIIVLFICFIFDVQVLSECWVCMCGQNNSLL